MRRIISIYLLCVVSAFAQGNAVDDQVKAQVESIRKDLKTSQEKLTAQRDAQTDERIALSTKLTQTQAELIEKRRQVRLSRMGSADRLALLKQLQTKEYENAEEISYLKTQLKSYSKRFSNTLLKGESTYDSLLEKGDALNDKALSLEAGLGRLENLLGGATIDAEGVDREGTVHKGKIAMVGPALWFQSSNGDIAGSVVLDKGSQTASVVGEDEENISALFNGDEVEASIDLTGGKARALESIDNSFTGLFKKGGLWVWPIILIALVSIVLAIIKLIQLSKIRTPAAGWLNGVLNDVRDGNQEAAQEACAGVSHPIGPVMKQALSGMSRGADVVEEIVYEQMISVQSKLQKWLPFIATTAAIAPLLGLLGTVSGMIRTFNIITVAGTGDAKPLAGGISEALVTTMFGLAVAIPALTLHSILSRKSQGIIQTTEKLGLTVVNGLRKLGK